MPYGADSGILRESQMPGVAGKHLGPPTLAEAALRGDVLYWDGAPVIRAPMGTRKNWMDKMIRHDKTNLKTHQELWVGKLMEALMMVHNYPILW